MYSTCIYCHAALGGNDELAYFPVGRRIAFDAERGRLWAVCEGCGRWNLAPLEERWEAVEECERRFRGTRLRYSTGSVGLARLRGGTELVRIGRPLRPEVAAWRYGQLLLRRRPLAARLAGGVAGAATGVLGRARALAGARRSAFDDDGAGERAAVRLLLRRRGARVLDVVRLPGSVGGAGEATDCPRVVVRYRDLPAVSLTRPERGRPWALVVPHDGGEVTLEGDEALRTASKLLAAANRLWTPGGASPELVERAVEKIDECAQPDSYFNRVVALALRSAWGREGPEAAAAAVAPAPAASLVAALDGASSDVERLALRLTGRAFWGHGGMGSAPRATLLDVPLVDRLALEMAAHEDAERRALEGELAELEAAWRDAEEIAAIADDLLPPPAPDRARLSWDRGDE